MTLVNTETGEIVESLTTDDARRLTSRIRLLAESVADSLDKIADLIDAARVGSAWLALGYRSWTEYVSSEFAGVLPRLDREPRQDFVRELSARGMSTRAIAPFVGADHSTVVRDLNSRGADAPPVPNGTPETPEPADDGEAEAGSGQTPEGEVTPEASSVSAPVEQPTPRPPVTGIDGKTYSRPAVAPKPVLDGDAAEYDNAAQACLGLTRAVSRLLTFEHPNMRVGMRSYWSLASAEVPPIQRRDVTPEQMRAAARGLLELADEWESQ